MDILKHSLNKKKPTLLVAHLQFSQVNAKVKNCKRATKPTHKNRNKIFTICVKIPCHGDKRQKDATW